MRLFVARFTALTVLLVATATVGGCTVSTRANIGPHNKRHEHRHCHASSSDDCHSHRHGPGHHRTKH